MARIAYDRRVLAMARLKTLPILDRLRFLEIFSRNLDDFFQVRVAGLKEQAQALAPPSSREGDPPAEQLRQIRSRVEEMVAEQAETFETELRPVLADAGIKIISADQLDRAGVEQLSTLFRDRIFPVLTPLAVDPGHPFPYISHLSLNLAVLVRDPLRRQQRFARVKVPPLLPRFIALQERTLFIPVEEVIAMNIQSLFPGMEIVRHDFFRVTRDNDLDVADSGAEDLLATVRTELLRQRHGALAVRLEVPAGFSEEVLELLLRELELDPEDVYVVPTLLNLAQLGDIVDLNRPDLKSEKWSPVTQPVFQTADGEPADLFSALQNGDILVHHPYDSFATSVEAFIEQAAHDPHVLAIKQTLYRTSGPASAITTALARAAESGKQVVALVELKARGDEQANIGSAQELEKAGVHVVYGVVGLKTHAKITLVVRQERNRIRRYVHIGTGNYNSSTAKVYEDIGLLSANPDIGADVSELFNFLTGYSRQRRYRKLLVAPVALRAGILKLIRDEAARSDGRILIKVNNLVDQEIIDALYEASQGGAEIDLIVRSMCCLRPGVPGLSDRIRVRSVLGDFLEHSRVFRFGSEKRGPAYFIGSADMMDRNLDRRVEALVPIEQEDLKARLAEIMRIDLEDRELAWELAADGVWSRVKGPGLNAQETFKEMARERDDRGFVSAAR